MHSHIKLMVVMQLATLIILIKELTIKIDIMLIALFTSKKRMEAISTYYFNSWEKEQARKLHIPSPSSS